MRRAILPAVLLALMLAWLVPANAEVESVSVMGFVWDKCGGCGATTQPGCGECKVYMDIFGRGRMELLSLIEDGRVSYDVHNVIYGDYRPEYFAYCDAFGVPEEQRKVFPQFFVGAPENGFVVTGEDAIEGMAEQVEALIQSLPADARTDYPKDELDAAKAKLDMEGNLIDSAEVEATAEPEPEVADETASDETASDEGFHRNDDLSDLSENDSKIVYVYKPQCEFCAQVRPLLEGLPDRIHLSDGTTSRIVFVSLDKDDYDQYQIVKQYYDALQIPEDHQYSPLLIVGDRYYMGYDEIVPSLLNALINGDGLNTDLSPVLEAQ